MLNAIGGPCLDYDSNKSNKMWTCYEKNKEMWAHLIYDDILKIIFFSCENEIVLWIFFIYGWNDVLSGIPSK